MNILLIWIWLVYILASVVGENFIVTRTGEIEPLRISAGATKASYFIPGLNGPRATIFKEYTKIIPGDVWLFNYSHLGFNPENHAKQIMAHAKEHGYTEVNVYAISIGAKVCRYIRFEEQDQITQNNWLICPANKPSYLYSGTRTAITVASPLLMVLRVGLGVVSDIPVIPIDGVLRSFADQAEQLFSLAYRSTELPENLRGIILSEDDQFLENREIALDTDVKTVVVPDVSHAEIGRSDKFITSGTKLGAFQDH